MHVPRSFSLLLIHALFLWNLACLGVTHEDHRSLYCKNPWRNILKWSLEHYMEVPWEYVANQPGFLAAGNLWYNETCLQRRQYRPTSEVALLVLCKRVRSLRIPKKFYSMTLLYSLPASRKIHNRFERPANVTRAINNLAAPASTIRWAV